MKQLRNLIYFVFALLLLTACTVTAAEELSPTALVVVATPTEAATLASELTPTELPTLPLPSATPAAEPTPTAVAMQSYQLDALAVRSVNGEQTGQVLPIDIEVRPAANMDKLRISVYTDTPGGEGDVWEASVWMAVIQAAMLEGIDPIQYEFSIGVSGNIDGPSAGALITVGTLAALRNEPVDPDVTLTASINPDGTFGPVGGIQFKIQAAQQAGKQLVLIPTGGIYETNPNTDESVNVIELGRELGIEVKPVSNILEAYEAMTGVTHPASFVEAVAPTLPQQATDRTIAKAEAWLSRYERVALDFEGQPVEAQELFTNDYIEAREQAQEARRLMEQGLHAPAFSQAYGAAALMNSVNTRAELYARLVQQGGDSALTVLNSQSTISGEVDALYKTLAAEQIETVSDAVALFDVYSDLAVAESYLLIADQLVDEMRRVVNDETASEGAALNMGLRATSLYALAGDRVAFAEDSADIALGFGSQPFTSLDKAMHIAETLEQSGKANINFFESALVDRFADQNDISRQASKQAWEAFDFTYVLAQACQNGLELMRQENRVPDAAVFGHSQCTFAFSAELIATHYSLDVEFDEQDRVAYIGQQNALADMLDFADERAKQTMTQAGEDVAIAAIRYYECARILRQGSPDEQLSALFYYWQATLLSQVSVYLMSP